MFRGSRRRGCRVVIDTCVLVAGISGFKQRVLSRGTSPSAKLLHTWIEKGNFVWLVSAELLDEYRQVLKRLRVRPHLIGRLVNLLQEEADFIDVGLVPDVSPDPGDNPICACAAEGGAEFIVTLNKSDFPQAQLNARVVAPGEFLLRIRK